MMKNKVLSLLCVSALLALSGCCCWRKSSCDRSYDDCCERDEYGMYEGGRSGRYMAPEGDYPHMIDGEYVRPYGENEPECYRPYDGTVSDPRGRRGSSRKDRRMSSRKSSMKHDVMPADMDDSMSHGMDHGG